MHGPFSEKKKGTHARKQNEIAAGTGRVGARELVGKRMGTRVERPRFLAPFPASSSAVSVPGKHCPAKLGGTQQRCKVDAGKKVVETQIHHKFKPLPGSVSLSVCRSTTSLAVNFQNVIPTTFAMCAGAF